MLLVTPKRNAQLDLFGIFLWGVGHRWGEGYFVRCNIKFRLGAFCAMLSGRHQVGSSVCSFISWVDWAQTTKLLTYLHLYHDGFSANLCGVPVCEVRQLSTSVSSTLFVLCVTDVTNAMQWSVPLLCAEWQMQLLQYSGLARSCFSVWQT